jgi:glycosyltransferase involved in cell wall biosynthesis
MVDNGKEMKIAYVTVSHKPINAASTGGIETFTIYLVNALIRAGADLTLFAAAETDMGVFPGAKLNPVFSLKDLGKKENENLESKEFTLNYTLMQTAGFKMALDQAWNFDVIHFNSAQWYIPLLLAGKEKKIFTTVHVNNLRSEVLSYLLNHYDTVNIANISETSAKIFSPYPNHRVVYNGIDVSQYDFNPKPDEYFAWLGRIAPVKGLSEAVQAAKLAGVGFRGSGPVDFPDYYQNQVVPYLDDKRIVEGPLDPKAKAEFLAKAKAVLMPVTWEEPFGLVAVEAMACGTPVIAYARGGLLETVEDGVTGYLIDPEDGEQKTEAGSWIIKKKGIEGLVEAMSRIAEIDRGACRRRAEELFSADVMARNYLDYYNNIIKQ